MSAAQGPTFGLEVAIGSAAAAEVLINDVLLARKAAGDPGALSLAIQSDVMPGRNIVEVLVGTATTGPRAAAAILPARPSDLFVTLRLQLDRVSGEGPRFEIATEDLAEEDWRPAATGQPVALPHRMVLAFDAPAETPAPAWAAGEIMRQAEILNPVMAELDRLHALLDRRDVEGFTNAMLARYADVARAYPLRGTPRRLREEDAAELGQIVGSPGFAMLPIEHHDVRLRLSAGGRLATCVSRDGHPLLRARIEGLPVPIDMPVLFSLIDGRLQAVR